MLITGGILELLASRGFEGIAPRKLLKCDYKYVILALQ